MKNKVVPHLLYSYVLLDDATTYVEIYSGDKLIETYGFYILDEWIRNSGIQYRVNMLLFRQDYNPDSITIHVYDMDSHCVLNIKEID